jgi:hypothetical protein
LVQVLEAVLTMTTGACVLSVAPVLRRLFKRTTIEDVTPEWVESFSVERYRPMLNLLADEDFAFLSSQPGFDPSIYKKLRRERLAIFDQYLSRLILDFKRLHTTARYLVAHSDTDQTAATTALLRLQWSFALSVLQVQARFQLVKVGVGTVQAQLLIAKLQQMNDQLRLVTIPNAA